MIQGLTLFRALDTQMGWLGQRQRVVAENIANSDTPNYSAQDLKPIDFKQFLRGAGQRIQTLLTNPNHLPPVTNDGEYRAEKLKTPSEFTSNKNSVSLEDETLRASETRQMHGLLASLYTKQLNMLHLSMRKVGQ